MIKDRPLEEVKQVVMDSVEGKVFTSMHVRECDISMIPFIFVPISLGAFARWSDAEVDNLGLIYQYLSKAGPRSINGYPMFFDCELLSMADAERFMILSKQYSEMRDGFIK